MNKNSVLLFSTEKCLYFSLLPEKKKAFPLDDEDRKCGDCSVRNLEDIPDEIMDATKSLVLKKEEDNNKFDISEFQQQLQTTLQSQKNQIDRMESQIQILLQLCSKK